MRLPKLVALSVACLLLVTLASAQEEPLRDPRAQEILEASYEAMGGVTPSDSEANGSLTRTAGSSREQGSCRVRSRGLDETKEETSTDSREKAVKYLDGAAEERADGGAVRKLSLELSATCQSVNFPLLVVAQALQDERYGFEYVDRDGGANRIRIWRHYSDPDLEHLSEFSEKHIWIDASSSLPTKLSFNRRAARGAAPRIPVEVFYSEYTRVGEVLYPYQIRKNYNGTPWETIHVTGVTLDAGLTDEDLGLE